MKKSWLSIAPVPLLLLTSCSPSAPDTELSQTAESRLDSQLVRSSLQRLKDMRTELGLTAEHSFQPRAQHQDSLGQSHVRFNQYYRGVRVWGSEVITHTGTNGESLAPTTALRQGIRVDVVPSLSATETANLVKAMLAPAQGFASEPLVDIELVVYPKTVSHVLPNRAHLAQAKLNALDFVTEVESYHLAYHVHTELENPGDTRHTDLIIDAHTGSVLEQWNSLQTGAAVGTGNSYYSGTVQITTDSIAGGYQIRDLTRPASGANVIYDLNHQTSGFGSLYQDVDNVWGDGANYKEDPEPTTSPNGQTAAVDAAYGLQSTWDMYKNVFGRYGIDGLGTATYARVHYDYAFDNAFFSDNCKCITYGDGTKLQTLTSLDVAAHEFSHGVTSATARLIYSKESGGLNESNSDIFGALTEFYMRGANGQGSVIPDTGGTWTQGEQITTAAYPLKMRFLYKPSKDGKSADAWSPTLKDLDVHYSSGPMNRAFYFLSQGATTTGDTSTTYLPEGMTGIGNQKAAQIWYRALTTYMTPSTDYAAVRIACIQAVRDLFPVSGPEEIAVWNAFAGINVGGPWAGPDAAPTATVSQTGESGTLTFSATASDDKGVARVDFLLDGLLVGSTTAAPYSMAYDSTLQDDGIHTLVARATDTVGLFTDATMTFTIANGQLLKNGSFEKGYGVGWSNTNGMQIGAILNTPCYNGLKCAKFNGLGEAKSVSLFQTVSVPATATSVTLSFALQVQTQETSSFARDTFVVEIRDTAGALLGTVASYSNLNAGAGYTVYNFDLSAYKGQTVQLYFTGTEDAAISTGFLLDRVRFYATGTGPADTTAPTVSVTESGTSGTITFSATASDDVGVSRVEFLVDGVLAGSDTTAPYSVTMDSLTLTNGSHTLVGKAYDAAGNVGTSTSVPFSVSNTGGGDTEAPVVSASETGTSGVITFSATATDNVGITRVEFQVDGVLKGSDTTSPYSMTLDSTTLTNGSHTLVALAYDAAGNVGTSTSVAFSVSNTVSTTFNEVESNGTTSTANAVADAVTKIVGFIGTSTDQDYFRITVPAGRTLTINMTGPARDYDLYLLNTSGGTLRSSANSGSTESVTYTNSLTTTATYYIKVVGFGGAFDTVNVYNLNLTR